MKKFSPVIFMAIATLVLALSTRSNAGERFGLKSHIELGGTIDFTSTSFSVSSNSTSVFSIEPYVGYFVMNRLEVGIRPMVTVTSPSTGSSTTDLAVFVAPSWNFSSKGSTVTPFVEGLVGFSSGDIVVTNAQAVPPTTTSANVSGLAYGARGGVKVQISEFGLLNFGLQYISLDRSPSGGVSNRENRISVGAGFSVFAY